MGPPRKGQRGDDDEEDAFASAGEDSISGSEVSSEPLNDAPEFESPSHTVEAKANGKLPAEGADSLQDEGETSVSKPTAADMPEPDYNEDDDDDGGSGRDDAAGNDAGV